MNAIQKLDSSLVWQPIETVKDDWAGLKKLQMRASKMGWSFVKDESLYGGYYADKNGDCYRVA